MTKHFLIGIACCLFFTACNDKSSTTTTHKDSAGHNSTLDNGSTNHPDNMSTNMGNRTIMDIMKKSMGEMKNMQSTGNPDNDFAAMMKIHHMSAIEAAEVEIAQGKDAQVKAMAQKMLNDQQKEVAEFNTFLSGHTPHGGGDAFHKEVMSMMGKMEMPMDHSGSIDKDFVQMMIPHHQSAVDMSKAYLKTGAHEAKLKSMANNIIVSQQKEIKELQAWLNKNK